jgi:hypothetical protein
MGSVFHMRDVMNRRRQRAAAREGGVNSEVLAHLRQVAENTRRARATFLLALLVCGAVGLLVTLSRGRPAGQWPTLSFSFGPLLLWSLTAAAYGFRSLDQATARMADRVAEILAADHARGLRQLAQIKARLRGPASPDGG